MWSYATAGLVVLASCYSPSFESCQVACASNADCAPGHTCTSGGLCAAPDQAAQCEAGPALDAAIDAPSIVGPYALIFTNRENGCAFPGWTDGATTTVDAQLTLNGAVVLADPQGLAAGFLDLWLGAHVFAGTRTGDTLALVLAGNKTTTHGNCVYTFDAALDATVTGDQLAGDLRYRARTNGMPACGSLTGCVTRQAINGARAPR